MHGCMRTTVTLDDDVFKLLRRLQAQRACSLRDVLNDVLRDALTRRPTKSKTRFVVQPFEVRRAVVASVDDVAAALAHAEGDDFR